MEAKAKEHESLSARTSGKEALNHAIAAAELYMKLAHASANSLEKKRLNKKCEELVLKAESLKKAARQTDTVAIVEKRLKLPRQARQIPTSEKTILYRNSRLHGNTFPPWELDPDPDEFRGETYRDTSAFPLSDRQQAVFAGWKRPLDIAAKVAPEVQDAPDRLMKAENEYDLVQDITTDCSVVASLCATIRHLRPGPKSILPALMFPVDSQSGQPQLSDNGKYVFRMFFNGCFRRVAIDDCLPSSSNDRTLYVADRQNPGLVWPALMEKAYLKVRGGYDFPGSNSGTDLCVLTGWIPQQLFLQSDDLDWNATWRRIKKAYDYGDVVITLGTGRLSSDEEEALGLAGEHDYAVLDMAESPKERRFLVKNPWCDGLVWKGVGTSSERYSKVDDDEYPVQLKPGSFWINFDDVTQNFESLYLNWNPSLFTQRQDHHFTWQLPEANMVNSFAHNPQYVFTAAEDDQTWILLSRHFQDEELEIARKRTTTLAAVSNMLGFTSLYIFSNNGQRVPLNDKSIYRGPFVDSPQTLAAFEARKGVRYTVVVASQDLPLPRYSFTLSFFSRTPLAVVPAPHPRRHYTELRAAWTRRSAGGNSASPTYATNPQFRVAVSRRGPLEVLLSTARDDLSVHVDVVWAGGRRVVAAVAVRDLVASSGEYRRGCALASVPALDPGAYTVVVSTFETGQLADFTLRVGADHLPLDVVPVPPDAAGRLRTQLPPLPLPLRPARRALKAPIAVARLTRASILVSTHSDRALAGQLQQRLGIGGAEGVVTGTGRGGTTSGMVSPRSHPVVLVTLESGRGPHRLILASTGSEVVGGGEVEHSAEDVAGDFREVGLGLRTPEFDITPGLTQSRAGLWLVVEQLGAAWDGDEGDTGDDQALLIEMLSDGHVSVGGWEAMDE
ncbi:hypothetical protein F4780DRAFT_768674 [Xylariomycetidae sp. FL0641]|nr:hypothetical protein F4780DRAFT_768674 [Xylariomycetidae sp. FL0641]